MAFGDWWFDGHTGERELADLDVDATLANLKVPVVLREFYAAIMRWPVHRMHFYFGWNQNFFAYPDRLAASQLFAEYGLIEFAFENQGVTSWVCPQHGDDPHVFDVALAGDAVGEPHNYPAGRCSMSLADFLIDFLLVEFALNGEAVGRLPSFVEHLDQAPERDVAVRVSAMNGRFHVGLFEDEVLVLRFSDRTNAPEAITPRNQAARALLRPFAGAITDVDFRWSVGDETSATEWYLSIGADGAGMVAASHAKRTRIRDRFRLELDLAALQDELRPDMQGTASARHVVRLQSNYEGRKLLTDDEMLDNRFVTTDAIAPLLALVVNAIEEPSDELAPLIDALISFAPIDWPT